MTSKGDLKLKKRQEYSYYHRKVHKIVDKLYSGISSLKVKKTLNKTENLFRKQELNLLRLTTAMVSFSTVNLSGNPRRVNGSTKYQYHNIAAATHL